MENKSKKFKIKVLTPEGVVFEGSADYVSIPGQVGVLGVLAGHTPLFSVIEHGELVIKNGIETVHLSVSGGFVDIGTDHVTALTDSALRSEDLDEEKIKEAKQKAEERLRERLSRQEYLAAEAQLRKILIDLKVSDRRKRRFTDNRPG